MRVSWLATVCLGAGIGLVACGLSIVGGGDGAANSESSSSSSSSSSGASGSNDGSSSGSVVQCDSGVVVDGSVVILPAEGAACPSGTTEQTVHTAPQPNAGACTCGVCTPTAEPTCAGPNFTWTWGGSAACTPGTRDYDITADSACVLLDTNNNFNLAGFNHWSRVPQGGACTAATVPVPTMVATTAIRQCIPNAPAAACAAISAGQRSCVSGDPDGGACSGSGMFSVPVVVGDGATVTCGACTCVRAAAACNVEYHDNTTCTNKKLERLADGQCLATGSPSVRAMKVYPMNPTCTPTPGAPTASLTNPRSLCCTP